jgi:hypothetical protein
MDAGLDWPARNPIRSARLDEERAKKKKGKLLEGGPCSLGS